jgi:hypothetical protein
MKYGLIIKINNMDNRIYCWWMNKDEMSENRKNSLRQLKEKSECEVIFIDKKNLGDYVLPDYPLHEGFQYLSEIQQGDYLKCYFMHHYGGGYSDIKKTTGSWIEFFNKINNDSDLYCIGYGEVDPGHIARLENCTLDPSKSKYCLDFSTNDDKTKWDSSQIKKNWSLLIGNGSFICKKNTPFTTDWWNALNEKMDGYLPQLKENPSKWSRDSKGSVNPNTNEISKYPISWAVINGNIFHPLSLKYHKNILNTLHYPVTINYQ